jgi:hypothetical protein
MQVWVNVSEKIPLVDQNWSARVNWATIETRPALLYPIFSSSLASLLVERTDVKIFLPSVYKMIVN